MTPASCQELRPRHDGGLGLVNSLSLAQHYQYRRIGGSEMTREFKDNLVKIALIA
jgi:hypothetical protein